MEEFPLIAWFIGQSVFIEWVTESLQSDWSITVSQIFTGNTRYQHNRDSEHQIQRYPICLPYAKGRAVQYKCIRD